MCCEHTVPTYRVASIEGHIWSQSMLRYVLQSKLLTTFVASIIYRLHQSFVFRLGLSIYLHTEVMGRSSI